MFLFFKQKTAYEMRISDWSSDVCSSDLRQQHEVAAERRYVPRRPERSEPQQRPERRAQQRAPGEPPSADRAGHRQRSGRERKKVGKETPEIGRASCRERVCQYV